MNPTCISFFNLETTDIKAEVLMAMIHPEDQAYVLSKLNACTEGQTVADVECRIRRNEHERWLNITPFLSTENKEQLLIGQAEDITAVKKNSEVLYNHNNKKNSILNILAHDLAGPIGTVQNLSTMLARETSHLNNPKIDQFISKINRICKSNIKLIHDFLDQEFIESAGVRLIKKRVNLVEKINVASQEYFGMQNELNIQFFCHANKEIIYLEIDQDKFLQVINNLISNALKFTPAGGAITIDIEEQQDYVLISVADNGIGIPEKFHATLFDKFTDARRSGLQGEHSTGLGMSIIKTIVEWHDGNIWFESEENKGTTFYIQLPKTIEGA